MTTGETIETAEPRDRPEDLQSDAAAGYRAERSLFDGDTGSFPLKIRQALVRLLRGPYIDGVADPRLWGLILDNREAIATYLCEVFLVLTIDPERKIAMLTPAEVDAPHTAPIQPRKPLRREETLLALRLRLLLDRHAGTGTEAVVSRAGAREILAEHRHPGMVDDKRLEELTDSSLARLAALKLLLPTELPDEYRVSSALALALPFDTIDEIPAYLDALDRTADSLEEELPFEGLGGADTGPDGSGPVPPGTIAPGAAGLDAASFDDGEDEL
ncbi:DUF4194 domain-containing protein [Arthrobacter sp. I2-34]|uniref:DUF4194 domain-containing protein n=1 Tax=Arthrobacter hankyongi TaxID=2904801 RepID=A0ABS9L2P7_9MICC|nr:DUF4194 domain-containing protein [Arthrobacter hankyongi]MCG2620908.1 DUF4194 domain-containing protein [Arthrobacter hankyongi]